MGRFFKRTALLVIVPLVAIGVGAYFYAIGGRYVSTENAYVKAKLVTVSADIDGRVTEVFVKNNQAVNKGDLLFRLDPEPAQITVAGMQAEIVNVKNRIDSLRTQYKQSQLEVGDARERIKFLSREQKRQEKLQNQKLGLKADYDKATHELKMGRRALSAAIQRSNQVLTELEGDPEKPAEEFALFLAAKAKLDEAERNLKLAQVTAPADGVASNVTLEAGEYVEAGEAIFTIVEIGDLWVEVNLKESQLTHVRQGQQATVVVDAFPDSEFAANVVSLAPATGAEFAILPPQNATGNWVKVVQRIPVRLEFTDAIPDNKLRAGMTTSISIDTLHKRELPPLVQTVLASVLPE